MMQAVCGVFAEGDVHLHLGAFSGSGIDLQETVDEFSTLPQVDHAEAGTGAAVREVWRLALGPDHCSAPSATLRRMGQGEER